MKGVSKTTKRLQTRKKAVYARPEAFEGERLGALHDWMLSVAKDMGVKVVQHD